MIDILQVTYGADIEWTKYSLRSIRKYVTGIREVIVCCPNGVEGIREITRDASVRLMLFDHRDPGHMQQQFIKLTADLWLPPQHEHVVYLDADCVFFKPVDLRRDLFQDGKPILMSADWENQGSSRWRTGTEALLGMSLPWNTMARHPSIFKTAHVNEVRRHLEIRHRDALEHIILKEWNQGISWFPPRNGKRWQPVGIPRFSEFCLLGGYCLNQHPGEYYHWDVAQVGYPPEGRDSLIKQYWSHHDVTPQIREELERIVS
jgi:hypothetical protein